MNKKNIAILFCFIFATICWEIDYSIAQQPEITPQQKITVNNKIKNSINPTWKDIWDQARIFAGNNELLEAKASYEELIALKPHIVAAAWEYCKVLVSLKEWDSAALVADNLLDYEPGNIQFLLTAGKIALKNKHYNKSTQYFGQVLEAEPVGKFSEEAILGLVEGLRALNNKKSALVLLEQYYQRGNAEQSVLVELAQLSKELGLYLKARQYFSILANNHPENKSYQHQLAEVYELTGDFDSAAIFWKKYLKLNPNYIPFHDKLARYYLDKNKISEALVHLKFTFQLKNSPPELSLQIADLYFEKQQRTDKALLYYEKYLRSFSDNTKINQRVKDIRSALAKEYLPIIENGAVENLWRDLDFITLNKAKIFLLIADLLEKEDKYDHELLVVQTLFEHSKAKDLDLAYRLAGLYQKNNNSEGAYELYLLLDQNHYSNEGYLLAKAANEIQLGFEFTGFNTYKKYLKRKPDDAQILAKLIELGGNLGIVESIIDLWREFPALKKTVKSNFQLRLGYIEALNKCGFYSQASELSSGLLIEFQGNNEKVVEIYYQLADSFVQRGLYFNAEQLLRQNLARDMDAERAIRKLVSLSIIQKRFADARAWLELLAKRHGFESIEEYPEKLPEKAHFLYIKLLLAEKEYDDAEETIINHVRYHEESDKSLNFKLQSYVFLMRIFYFQEEYEKCKEKIWELGRYNYDQNELYVLSKIIKDIQKERFDDQKAEYVNQNHTAFTSLLKRAYWFRKYGHDEFALEQIMEALAKEPQSMIAMMQQIDILTSLSRFGEAIDVVNKISEVIPEEEYFDTLKLKLQFQSGKFDTIVEKIPIKPESPPETPQDDETQQGSYDTYFSKRLLLARALWAENRRKEAIEVYNSLLAVPVDSMFLEKVEIENINFKMPPLKKSIWNYITFTSPDQPDPITTVMAPQFMEQNIGDPVDNLAASLYGKYRWQELVKKELSARKAVERKDYYHAEKEYISLLEEEKSPESLFDLANIYHKLGLYGKAAELYEIMKKKGPMYPGLDEYIQANLLKRRPRVSVSLSAESKRGREGYVNLKKRAYGLEAWITPNNNQEVSVQAFFNQYRSKGTSERFRTERVLTAFSTYFGNSTDLNIHFGVDSPSSDGTTEFLYKFEFIQRINKFLEVYGRFEQDLVEDTLRSVTDSVIYRDFEAGVKYDPLPRWFVGVDYRHRMYSDDNTQNRYKFWSQYHLFGDVNQFKMKYSYEVIRNENGNLGRQNDYSNIFEDGDSVYWSPTKYWQQRLNFHFKHFIEKDNYFDSLFNYFTIDYTYGYDNNRQQSHEFDLNFFLEITRHFLLKGNLHKLNGDELEETQTGFSIIYRW